METVSSAMELEGYFSLDKPLDDETYRLLFGLATTRRMKYDVEALEKAGFGDAKSFGKEGKFFVGEAPGAVLDATSPPGKQPSLYCCWIPAKDRVRIVPTGHDESHRELADSPEDWMAYLIENILKPRGYMVNGVANVTHDFFGDGEDLGYESVIVEDNVVKSKNKHSEGVDGAWIDDSEIYG